MADDFSSFPEVTPTSSGAKGEFDSFPAVDTGKPRLAPMGDQISAGAEAAGRSALEGSGILSGAMLGGMGGAAIAGPPGGVVGAIGGGIAGYFAGDSAASSLGLRSPEQMDPSVRPGAYAGQSLGGAATFMAAPFAAAPTAFRFGESMAGRYLNQIIETAKKYPIATLAGEVSSAASSAGGAAVSEMVAHGRADIRVNAEMVAGIVNPTRLAISAFQLSKGITMKAVQLMSPAARETEAGKTLQAVFKTTGEDPTVIARILRQQGVLDDSNLTAAQKSGSMALGAVSEHLARVDARYGAEAAAKAKDGLDAIRGQITLLTKTGDPAAISAAQQLRATYYRTLLSQSVQMAQDDAVRAAGKITKDTPAVREQLSLRAREALEKSIADARGVEGDLWSKVDGTRPAKIDNLQNTFDEILQDTLPELRAKKMPTVVKNFIDRVTKPQDAAFSYDPATLSVITPDTAPSGTNVGELRRMRSELLAMSRAAARDPDQVGMERIYSQLAEASMDDLDGAFKGAADNAYNEARTFTREMNDVFTRSFAGKVVAQGKYGDRVAPEILLRKALSTGKELGAAQLAELEDATAFLPTRGFTDDGAHKVMLDAQERLFRLAAADAVDPATGVAKPERVAKFIKDNPTLMRRFPEVQMDLQAAVKSQSRLKTLESRAKGVEDILSKQGAFGSLIGASGNNPENLANAARKAADRVLVSADQESELIKLINVAKGGGTGRGGRIVIQPDDAVSGLRASLFNSILDKSTNRIDGVLNLEQVRTHLFAPTTVGKKPLATVMQEQGILTAKEVAGTRELFDMVDNIQRAAKSGTAVEVKTGIGDAAIKLIARITGSRIVSIAQKATNSGNGASIIIHGAAARFADDLVTKIPNASSQKILVEMMNDPAKMALLLTKVETPQAASFKARQIHAWLVQSGLTGVTDIPREYEQKPAAPQMFSAPR
jgi:hypothetical protein